MSEPQASVVVPTYRRPQQLRGLVGSLTSQEGVGSYEVIVVDDCSGDETGEIMAELAAAAPVPLRTLAMPRNAGPASARNAGWRAALAPLVVFTDDDCIPQPDWLAAMVSALTRADVVQGLTEVDPAELAIIGPFSRTMVVDRFSWKFETCNLGVRKAALEALGGFDESFREPYGEDFDLGWRALKHGCTAGWAPEARVHHLVETTGSHLGDWWVSLRRTWLSRYAAEMIRNHPEMRRHLRCRLFYQPDHLLTLEALAGIAIASSGPTRPARMAVAGALAVPWLHHRLTKERPASRATRLPLALAMALVIDAAEVAAVVYGAVRTRKLVL